MCEMLNGDEPRPLRRCAPGFLVGGECYCPECFKEWAKDEIDSDPEAVAAAMGIAVLTIPEG